MALDDWEKQSSGNILVSQLVAWEAAGSSIAGLLRLQSALTKEQHASGEFSILQLALDKTQLRDLGEALLNMAAQIDAEPRQAEQ